MSDGQPQNEGPKPLPNIPRVEVVKEWQRDVPHPPPPPKPAD